MTAGPETTTVASLRRPKMAENQCERCGVACHSTVSDGNGRSVVVKGLHCKFMVAETDGTTTCSVYAERFKRAPWCHSAREVKDSGFLRDGCPYNDKSGGKVFLQEDAYAEIWPTVLLQARIHLWPCWVSPAAFLTELAKREPQTEWECVDRDGGRVFQPKGQPPSFTIQYPDVLRKD